MPASGDAPQDSLTIVGATVIDGTGRAPITDAVLEVRGTRIADVYGRGSGPLPEDGATFDGRGLTIVPGLIEAHAHVSLLPHNFPDAVVDTLLTAFIDYGVTSVRDTGSYDMGPFFQRLAAGVPEWPRFFGSGPVIDGPPGAQWAGTRVVKVADEAIREVQDLASQGAVLIKTYKFMTSELTLAVTRAAHELGLPVTTHVGRIGADEAIRCGVDAIEHMLNGPELLADEMPDLASTLADGGFDLDTSVRTWRNVDPTSDRAHRSMDLMAERDVILVPTLVLSEAILLGLGSGLAERLGIAQMPQEVQDRWQKMVKHHDGDADDVAADMRAFEHQLEYVGMAHKRGVKIAAGTDGLGHWLSPGASLHEELRLLSHAGLDPMATVLAATSLNATLLGRDDLGRIGRAKLADFIAVRTDPLNDHAALKDIQAVVKDGRVVAGELRPLITQ